MTTYQVKTAVFEGPLDLLLQLITRHQVDITALSLSDLVAEYLAHLELMRSHDLEITSEFLLIASTLIQLKARRLLPEDTELDLDEELALMEERDRLLSRLLACATFKDVAAVFSHRLEAMGDYVGRQAGLDPGITPNPPEVKVPLGPSGLARLAGRILRRADAEPDLDHLDLELPDVQEALSDLRRRVAELAEAEFRSLTAHCSRRVEVVAYFLAMLELARWGAVEVRQEHLDAEITLRHRPETETTGLVSEWGR